MVKRALITGITGQDGSYLSELLLDKGYEVFGLIRRSSGPNLSRLDHIKDRITFRFGDLGDTASLIRALQAIQPHEIYNLASQSHVRVSFDVPEYTEDVTASGAVRLFEACRILGLTEARIYQASSSEMFGSCPPPHDEASAFQPRSPYGIAKCYAYWMARNYREAHGLKIANGILFNHESPRRGDFFVTKKVTQAVARIVLGLQEKVTLGNLDASRDWGFAGDYVEAMWRMQQVDPEDFVVATGEAHTVREFVEAAFAHVGLDWQRFVEFDPTFYRPTEVDALQGDASKARRILGWQPTVTFRGLVAMMVESDLAEQGKQLLTARRSVS